MIKCCSGDNGNVIFKVEIEKCHTAAIKLLVRCYKCTAMNLMSKKVHVREHFEIQILLVASPCKLKHICSRDFLHQLIVCIYLTPAGITRNQIINILSISIHCQAVMQSARPCTNYQFLTCTRIQS